MADDMNFILRSGAVDSEVAKVVRHEMDKGLRNVAAEQRSAPLPPDEALDGFQITDADIARAAADWSASVEDWAVPLLDAKPVGDVPK